MVSRLTLFLKSTVAKMTMTLERQGKLLLIACKAITYARQNPVSIPGFNVPKDGVWCR